VNLLGTSPVVFALFLGLSLFILGWAAAVVIRQTHDRHHFQMPMPGKLVYLAITAVGALAGVTMIQLGWVEYLGTGPFIQSLVFLSIGLFGALYVAAKIPYYENAWGARRSALLVVVIMAVSVIISPHLVKGSLALTTGVQTGVVLTPVVQTPALTEGNGVPLILQLEISAPEIGVGQSAVAAVRLANEGNTLFRDVKLDVDLSTGLIITEKQEWAGGALGPGESREFFYVLFPRQAGEHEFGVGVNYIGAAQAQKTISKTVDLRALAPKVEVQRLLSAEKVRSGDKVTTFVTFKNVGKVVVRDLKLLDRVPEEFAVVEGSNSFHLDFLRLGDSTGFSYTVEVGELAGTYSMGLETNPVTFKDLAGNEYTVSEQHKLIEVIREDGPSARSPVIMSLEVPSLRVHTPVLEFMLTPGESHTIPLKISELGSADASLSLQLEGALAPWISTTSHQIITKASSTNIPITLAIPADTMPGRYEGRLNLISGSFGKLQDVLLRANVQRLKVTRGGPAPEQIVLGTQVPYTVVIHNPGQDSIQLEFVEVIPNGVSIAGVNLSSPIGNVEKQGNLIIWSGELGPGQTTSIYYNLTFVFEGQYAVAGTVHYMGDIIYHPFTVESRYDVVKKRE